MSSAWKNVGMTVTCTGCNGNHGLRFVAASKPTVASKDGNCRPARLRYPQGFHLARFALKTFIQTQKGSSEHLFILTRTHSMHSLGEIPLSSHKTTFKQQINGPKTMKNERKRLILFWFSFSVRCLEDC